MRQTIMSKAILVMNMPENCEKCPFIGFDNDGEPMCTYPFIASDGVKKFYRMCDDNYNRDRQDWCPLKEIPERKEIKDFSGSLVASGFGAGWNACIDKIMAGSEEKQ